jgi:putative oxidoreductase
MFEIQPFKLDFPPFVMTVGQGGLSPLAAELGQSREAAGVDTDRSPKRWFYKLNTSPPSAQELGLALVRVGFGLSMAFAHGLGKLSNAEGFVGGLSKNGFPAPTLFGWAAILSEFAGGLLLALGLLSRAAASFVLGTMAVAAFYVHAADPYQRKELALGYALVSIAVIVAGPGRFSLDALLFGHSRRAPSAT